MSKIQVLSDVLASQVAAGEVVERPASVVKELVENSIDAGADHIEVEIQKGGASMVKITDNGYGMSREDALMCLERHATSKLHSVDQLSAISTMGFRGEAIPSIASVSQFRLTTREQGAVEGSELIVNGGIVKDVRAAGLPVGTVIEVKNLFFNIPARRKFMRAETTETAHIEHQIRLHALAAPQIRFTYRKDGRVVFDLPPTKDRRVRIGGLVGKDSARILREVPFLEQSEMTICGYILPSEFARKGRRQQFVFLNGRPIEDSAVSRAIKDGFRGSIADGLNPTAWLWLEMNPRLVDINVHPAKKEVRFHKPFDVRKLVAEAVEASFELAPSPDSLRGLPKVVSKMSGDSFRVEQTPISRADSDQGSKPQAPGLIPSPNDSVVLPAVSSLNVKSKVPEAESKKEGQNVVPSSKASDGLASARPEQSDISNMAASRSVQQELSSTPDPVVVERLDFRTIGVLHERYILLEGEEGLVLLDPKAARERITYEAFLAAAESGNIESQGLLVPELVELDAYDLDIVLRHRDNFADAGIDLESFGGGTVQVRSMPNLLSFRDPRSFLLEVIDELVETQGARKSKMMAFEQFASQLARNASRNEPCKLSQVTELLDSMFACELPYCTSSGSPTLIHISLKELEKKFSS